MSRLSRLSRWIFFGPVTCGTFIAAGAAWGSIDDLKAEAKKVTDADSALDLARRLRRAGLFTDGITVLQKGMGKARGNEQLSAIHLELARLYLEEHVPKKAQRECDQIHKLVPFTEQLCIAEAQLYNRRGSAALPAAEQALGLKAGDYDAMVAKGRALSQLGQPGDAEAALRSAAAAVPNRPEALRFLAELLTAQGKREAGLAALREARRVAPDDPEALGQLGELLDPGPEARSSLEHALEIRPSFSSARARLGRVLMDLGDLQGAEKMLTKALSEDPRQADWHAALGELRILTHEPDQALKSAHDALKIVQNHGAAKLVEAEALAAKGDIDLAVEAFEAAYGYSRLTPRALLVAAQACLKAGRLTTARAFAERATQDFPKSAAAWDVLGDVLSGSKETNAAKKAYDSALSGEGPIDKDAVRKKRAALK